jgi:chromosomal replication initiation ATPase DnaA
MENMKRTFDLEIYKLLYWIFLRKGREELVKILQYEKSKIVASKGIIPIEKIQKIVSEWSNVPISEINKKTRNRDIVELRQITMYLSRLFSKNSLFTKTSFAEIGKKCGNKDHATAMHACKTVANLRSNNREFREKYQHLFDKFNI